MYYTLKVRVKYSFLESKPSTIIRTASILSTFWFILAIIRPHIYVLVKKEKETKTTFVSEELQREVNLWSSTVIWKIMSPCNFRPIIKLNITALSNTFSKPFRYPFINLCSSDSCDKIRSSVKNPNLFFSQDLLFLCVLFYILFSKCVMWVWLSPSTVLSFFSYNNNVPFEVLQHLSVHSTPFLF